MAAGVEASAGPRAFAPAKASTPTVHIILIPTVFVDTSAFLAVLDRDEQNHTSARQIWADLIREETTSISTNYVLIKTLALIQRRFGMSLVHALQENAVPLLQIEWVDEPLHQAGVGALFTANRRHLSLVDCISFETMRRLGIDTVFAFDQHFVEHGFT